MSVDPDKGTFAFLSKGEYNHGFFGCFKTPILCVASCFCPCFVVGRMTAEMDGHAFNIVTCLCWPIGVFRNRRRIQEKHEHAENLDASTLASTICHCCA